jgi:hypothetical protein
MKRRLILQFGIFVLLLSPNILFAQTQSSEKKNWLEYYNLLTAKFQNPALDYAPFTRWWLPGNDVTKEELKREINLFADNNFGGVEIQPMAMVFPTKGAGRSDRIMSYDTPFYYDNLKSLFEEARKRGITVDLTDGSGWPAGGPHLTEADNNLTLEYGMIDIPSANKSTLAVPRASRGDRPTAKLIALLVANVLRDTTSENKTFVLDTKSVQNITSKIKDNKFVFTPANKGSWKAIAFWSMADMERPMLIAKKESGFAMNHFDSTKVIKSYNHFFGEQTGQQPYFGNPVRAIFDDSYEFRADRHFSDDFISTFKTNRGYDVTPYLPANMWLGYNNMYIRMDKPGLKPDFVFTDEDWRLRYDYDMTISDLLGKHFLKSTKNWTESKGLLHRTQPYGLNMDNMATAGKASIPEVETMLFSKATEGGYKLITSGAHLYNRPIVSCETAVYINRAFMTTPQKLKLTIDKLLSSGVNQIIYHGTAYQYFPEGYPKEGWYPFINSNLPGVNFSSNINESDPFWKYMKDINKYAQRTQYALRSGKPQADVLIYYPFLNFSEDTSNPNEILLNGYIKDVEPPLSSENNSSSDNRKIDTEWLDKIWPLINELNARGITWDWVNDASIQEMSVGKDKQLAIRGNNYKSIVLFDLPYIQLKSAQQLNKLSKIGANILAIGKLPEIQPSFNNFKKNDQLTATEMVNAVKSPSTTRLESIVGIENWCNKLNLPVKNTAKYDFIRQIRRVMDDGSLVQLIWNESDAWQKISVTMNKNFIDASWMNAENGAITTAEIKTGNTAEYLLPPFGTIFLNASASPISNTQQVLTQSFVPSKATPILDIEKWTIKSDSVTITNTSLFDWKTNNQLKYSSKEGIYTSTFTVDKLTPNTPYYIDLGKVYFSADLTINGKLVGSKIYTPFIFNISDYIKAGVNEIRINVTPTQLNGFIGEANNGQRLYREFKNKELMSQGLIGPIRIYEQKNK